MKLFILSLIGIFVACIAELQAQDTTIELPHQDIVMVPRLKPMVIASKNKAVLRTAPNTQSDVYTTEATAFVVMNETGDWYEVAVPEKTSSETAEEAFEVRLVYAFKKDFKKARLQLITEDILQQTGYEICIRKEGKHKGLCLMWSHKAPLTDNTMEIMVGRLNNERIACFRSGYWYSIDHENERVFLHCILNQATVEFQLGKTCTKRNPEGTLQADFSRLTDEDLDHMLPALEIANVYDCAYAAIDKQDTFFYLYLPFYGSMGNYWDNRYPITDPPAYQLVPLK